MPDDVANVEGLSNRFKEAGTGHVIELTIAIPNCTAVIRSQNRTIEDQFVFSFDEFVRFFRPRQQFIIGYTTVRSGGEGYFAVKDSSGKRRKYKLASGQIDELLKWVFGEVSKRLNLQIKENLAAKQAELSERLEAFRDTVGVTDLLEFREMRYRREQLSVDNPQEAPSFLYIALAEDALYILHEPPEQSHPLFPAPLKRLEYQDCHFAGRDFAYFLGQLIGRLTALRLRGEWSVMCRLVTKEGEHHLIGHKAHARALERALAR